MRLLEDGQIIRDTYEVERFLGEGAFAEVYRVKHRFLGRQAMKVFKRTGMSLDDINDMLGEAVLLSRIGHPNIVRVFDANVTETPRGMCGYFTMENVSGGSLEKFWHSHGGSLVPIETTLDLMKQVCRGIALAHCEKPPIIHRDIKPQNILVGYEADGLRARISDFGLAKKVNPLTLLATAAGTLTFKPPEIFTQVKCDSCAADVWAIGTTLYLLLTDRLPFQLPPDASWDEPDMFEGEFPPPSDINPDANKALDRIVFRALEKRPEDRYQTAKKVGDALRKAPWSAATCREKAVATTARLCATSRLSDGGDKSHALHGALRTKKRRSFARAGRLQSSEPSLFIRSCSSCRSFSRSCSHWRCSAQLQCRHPMSVREQSHLEQAQ